MIPITDVREAAALVVRTTDRLLATSNEQKGRSGSDLRRACGDMKAHAETYIVENTIAEKLDNCFVQAETTGATFEEFEVIRAAAVAETTVSSLAVVLKYACVDFALQHMGSTLIGKEFTSRDAVEATMKVIQPAFGEAEEAAADEVVPMVYQALVKLHSAIVFHLYSTARPLPRMLRYEFAQPRPTLVLSYRLYDTAARADELRKENKIVHPAFAGRTGRALSA